MILSLNEAALSQCYGQLVLDSEGNLFQINFTMPLRNKFCLVKMKKKKNNIASSFCHFIKIEIKSLMKKIKQLRES